MDNSAILKPATSLSTTETEKPNDSPHSDSQLIKTASNTITPSDKTILTDATKGMENATTPHSSVTANTGSNSGDKAITTDTTKVVENTTVLHPNIASSAGEVGKIALNDSTHTTDSDIHLSDKAIATDAAKVIGSTPHSSTITDIKNSAHNVRFYTDKINEVELGANSTTYKINHDNTIISTEVSKDKITTNIKDSLNSEMNFNLNIHHDQENSAQSPQNKSNLNDLLVNKKYFADLPGSSNSLTFSYSEPNGQVKSCNSPVINGDALYSTAISDKGYSIEGATGVEYVEYKDDNRMGGRWDYRVGDDKATSCSLLEAMDKTLRTYVTVVHPNNINGQEYQVHGGSYIDGYNTSMVNPDQIISGVMTKVNFNPTNIDISFALPDAPADQRSHFLIETAGNYLPRNDLDFGLASVSTPLLDRYNVSFTSPPDLDLISCSRSLVANGLVELMVDNNVIYCDFPGKTIPIYPGIKLFPDEANRICADIGSIPRTSSYSHEII